MTDLSNFNKTGVNLLLAEDRAGTIAYLDANHPTNFIEFAGALGEYVLNALQATSTSSVAIGTGSKSFTLTTAKSWLKGTPVFIYDIDDPENKYMHGQLTADEASGVITVNVVSAEGSGTLNNWRIIILAFTTTVLTPPLTVAQGGTGETSISAVRQSFELARKIEVLSIEATPPGSPTDGDKHLVGHVELSAGGLSWTEPTGDFAGQVNKVAIRSGGAWTFEDPNDGDFIVVTGGNLQGRVLVRQEIFPGWPGHRSAPRLAWPQTGCEWFSLQEERHGLELSATQYLDSLQDNNGNNLEMHWFTHVILQGGSGQTLYTWNSQYDAANGARLVIYNHSGNDWTISNGGPPAVFSGGVASFTLSDDQSVILEYYFDNLFTDNHISRFMSL